MRNMEIGVGILNTSSGFHELKSYFDKLKNLWVS